ncbi:MAG: hypothetical protein CMG07_05030 [Candidatus Marinimicrobia bacterium]|nr:hypothetical protein [Candidatus Neomarinimicrobiota bacterium]
MKFIYIFITMLSISFSNFVSEKQYDIESLILAPCCYGGIVSEHNSPMSKLISNFVKEIYSENFDNQQAISKLDEIIDFSIKNGLINRTNNQENYNLISHNMDQEVFLELFVNLFGEKIRAVPQNNFFGKITWIFPYSIMIIGIITVSYIIKKLSSNNEQILSEVEKEKIELHIEKYDSNVY